MCSGTRFGVCTNSVVTARTDYIGRLGADLNEIIAEWRSGGMDSLGSDRRLGSTRRGRMNGCNGGGCSGSVRGRSIRKGSCIFSSFSVLILSHLSQILHRSFLLLSIVLWVFVESSAWKRVLVFFLSRGCG